MKLKKKFKKSKAFFKFTLNVIMKSYNRLLRILPKVNVWQIIWDFHQIKSNPFLSNLDRLLSESLDECRTCSYKTGKKEVPSPEIIPETRFYPDKIAFYFGRG